MHIQSNDRGVLTLILDKLLCGPQSPHLECEKTRGQLGGSNVIIHV